MGLSIDRLAFFEEHRHCGDLASDVDGGCVWMTCEAGFWRAVEDPQDAAPDPS